METEISEISLRVTLPGLAAALTRGRPVPAGLSRLGQGRLLFSFGSGNKTSVAWLWFRRNDPHQASAWAKAPPSVPGMAPGAPGLIWDLADSGETHLSGGNLPPHRIAGVRLVGPGMEWLPGRRELSNRLAAPPALAAWIREARRSHEREVGARSRLIGALGERAVATLSTLTVAVVGCGRMGSQIADDLARLGCSLLLADGDTIEASNLDAMLAYPEDVGRNKADVLAERLSKLVPVTALALPVEHPATLRALRSCDFMVSAVDDDGARALCALVAAAWLLPHLDVATGVRAEGRERGADLRLMLPGSGCLYCQGGFARLGDLDRMHKDQGRHTDWRQESRAGSLRSLNGIAAHFALRLFEELVRGELHAGAWWQLDERLPHSFTSVAMPSMVARPGKPCPICALAGCGDAVLGRLPEMMKRMAQME